MSWISVTSVDEDDDDDEIWISGCCKSTQSSLNWFRSTFLLVIFQHNSAPVRGFSKIALFLFY